MNKDKKTSPNAKPFSQACFWLVLLPFAVGIGAMLIWLIVQFFNARWWYGLDTVLVVNVFFLVCLAIIAFATWRIGRRFYRSRQIDQEHARIERLMEQEYIETNDLENIEETHLSQNQQDSL